MTAMRISKRERICFNIDLVYGTLRLIQNPHWGYNLHCISDANERMSAIFISHLIDFGFDSVLEYLGAYLGLDSLTLLLAKFVGLSYSTKFHKKSCMSKVNDRAFRIIIPLQFLRG